MFKLTFWIAAAERAIKTAAQAAILSLGADALGALNAGLLDAWTVDWLAVVGFAVGGFVLSVLTSLASGIDGTGPSLGGAEVLPAYDPKYDLEETP